MSRKFSFPLKESFGLKVVFSFVVVIILILTAFTLFAVVGEGEKTKKNLKGQGEMLAALLAHNSTVGVFAENKSLLKDAAEGILGLKDVSAVSIYNGNLKVLYSSDKISSRKDAVAISEMSLNGTNGRSTVVETPSSFEFLKPVLIKSVSADESIYFGRENSDRPSKVVGYVRVILSKDSYQKEIISVLERNAAIMLSFIVAGIFVVYFAVKKVTRPLEKLTENVKALGQGMPVGQTPVESKDEIGNLASAFNAMVIARGRAEESLRQSEKKFRMLAENAAAAIFIYHGASLIYLNSTTEKLTGYTREELLGMNFWGIVHPEYQKTIKKLTADDPQTGNPAFDFECEFKIITKTGDERWVDLTSRPIEFEGQPAALGTTYDVTERKKLEEQFRQAQKMETVGLLAGGVAHDFNNILTAIISYGYLAKTTEVDKESVLAYIDQILSATERGANLTQGLLAFSRKQIINPKPAKVNEVIAEVERLLMRIIGEDIKLRTELTARDMTIMADTGQIGQVIMNLATNARHAMPSGGVLTIKTDRAELDHEFIKTHGYGARGAYAVVTVADTGVGMDEKTRERIFEPFFTTKEVGKGTGLGLSIVYGIIKQHNGYITVSTELGKGTSFNIYFPLIQSSPAPVEVGPLLGASFEGSETLLLVEDDETVRDLTATILAESGYTVISAADGVEALVKFSENREQVKLLILDVIMPGKNGKEVWEEIRSVRPDIKVLFITGYPSDIFERENLPIQDLNIMSKPVSPRELLKKVRETLDEIKAEVG